MAHMEQKEATKQGTHGVLPEPLKEIVQYLYTSICSSPDQ